MTPVRALVTVVIPTRNRLSLLQQAVASVEQQSLADWQLMIIDDASDDDTWSWIEEHRTDKVRGVRLEAQAERSAARNSGLQASDSSYILFLDDDDLLRPRGLEQLTEAFAQHADAVAAVGGLDYFDDEGGHRVAGEHPHRPLKRRVWHELVFEWVAETGRTLFRTQAVRDVGGFTAGLVVGEDRDLWLRVSRLGPALFVPETVLDHRIHPGQWRPADTAETEREITRKHLETLPEADRRVGERIVVARTHYMRARSAWNEGRPRESLRSWWRMRRAPVHLVASPLLKPERARLRHALVGALLGERGVQTARNVASAKRDARGGETWTVQSRQLQTAPDALPSDALDVSVVIATRNRPLLLREAIDSVLEQTFRSRELIVVDDASDGQAPQWLATDEDIRTIGFDEPVGRSVARNAGFEIARGRYVLFLDDDDRLRPDALQHLASALKDQPDAIAAVGGYELFDEKDDRVAVPHPRRRMKRNVWDEVVFGWVGHGGRTLLDARVHRECGGFVEGLELAEDRDLWIRLSRRGPVVLVPDIVLDKRVHSGQQASPDWEAWGLDVVRRRLAELTDREQRRGQRIIDARIHYSNGIRRLADGHPVGAATEFAQLVRAPLAMLTSPLFRQQLRTHAGRLVATSLRRRPKERGHA